MNANVDTTIDPSGRTQLGGYLSGLRYSAVEPYHEVASHLETRYIIQGKVIDTEGQPVWGIAAQIGDETVFSDSNGEFFVHVKTDRPQPFKVVADSSLQSAPWNLQSAPTVAQGKPEGSPDDQVTVVVHMARNMSAR
jgi:hypothetical protein